jgi:4-amino-4-deoxy-L-arabinose transferase-like glycosyltransferase
VSAFAARFSRVPQTRRASLAAELTALAVIVAAAAYVWTRDLHTYPNFDEGNYLGSLDALRHGQSLGRDVFLDQPPGWYLLLVAVSYPFGNSLDGVRIGLTVVGLTSIVAVYLMGRLVGGPLTGVIAASVLAVARPLPAFAGLVESEPACAALAVSAVAFAVYAYRDRTIAWAAYASGVLLAASTAVKLPGATAALPIASLALLCGARAPWWRRLAWPVAGGATVIAAIVIAYRHALPQIWHGVFTAHTRILASRTAESNVHRAATFVDPRTPFGCLVILGAVGSIVVAVRGRDRRLLLSLWLWALAGYAFILSFHPLSDHHFVILAVTLAVPSGIGLGLFATHARLPLPAVALATLVIAAFFVAGIVKDRNEIVGANMPYPPEIRWAIAQLGEHTSSSKLVVSDLPIVPYLAHRQMPGQLIDTSIGRIGLEDLPPRGVLADIDASHPSAAIIGRMFQTKAAIIDGIRSRFARRLHYQVAGSSYYVDIYLDPK